jgi:hypothetical protein
MSSWPLKLTSGFSGQAPNIVRTTPFAILNRKPMQTIIFVQFWIVSMFRKNRLKKGKLRQEVGR